MKNLSFFKKVFALCVVLFFVIACKKEDTSITNQTQTQIQNAVQVGTWRITKFSDSGVDETVHFTGYNFTFSSSGIISAVNNSTSYIGSWSIYDSNSNDDSRSDLDFVLNFNLTNDFEDLNDDWDFISNSSTKIELIDVSGGNGGTDYLTFEKN